MYVHAGAHHSFRHTSLVIGISSAHTQIPNMQRHNWKKEQIASFNIYNIMYKVNHNILAKATLLRPLSGTVANPWRHAAVSGTAVHVVVKQVRL